MATWVTHLIIADKVLERLPFLLKHEFCVGNIAPDCNIENEDWTSFTPTRELTHWMDGTAKSFADSDRFLNGFIKAKDVSSAEEESFLLGYYSHLIADAQFQASIRDEERIKRAWSRIRSDPVLSKKASVMEESWDSIKALLPKDERMAGIYSIERKYLDENPGSGYLTDILTLRSFPDYIDYLPKGAIPRKVKVMGYIPGISMDKHQYIAISEEEYLDFIERSADIITSAILKYKKDATNDGTSCE